MIFAPFPGSVCSGTCPIPTLDHRKKKKKKEKEKEDDDDDDSERPTTTFASVIHILHIHHAVELKCSN